MKAQNKLAVAGLVVLFICTGFFREFLFVNINEQMRISYYNAPESFLAPSLNWLSSFDYTTLYYMKWPLTLAFTAVFAFYSATVVRLVFNDKSLVKITWLAYTFVFTLSFLFFLFGMLIGSRETTYGIARFLAGIIETPAMLAVLVASFLLLRKN